MRTTALLALLQGCFSLVALSGCGNAAESGSGSGVTSSGGAGAGGGFGAGGGSAGGGTGGVGGSGSTTTTTVCDTPLAGGPAASPYPFTLGGQDAWSHDDGFPGGYFHTYDALDVGGSDPHKVHVFVPRDYGPCDEGYPVVYMNDGSTAFWKGGPGNKSWDVAATLGDLWAEGALPKIIVVAVEPNNRDYEYSYVKWSDAGACCGADQYVAYLADHVKPFIDGAYRTNPAARSTAIVGSSRGGLSSFHVATRRPEVFGMAACLSPSFWAGLDPVFGGSLPGGALADSGLVVPVEQTLSDPPLRPRLWIDWGLVRTGGFHNEVIEAAATTRGKEMVGLLEGTYGYADGSELFWEEDPEGEHDEVSWARRFPHVMKAFFGP